MAAIIPTSPEVTPDLKSTFVSRPLYGRTVSGYANGVNHLAGFRGLRFIQSQGIIDGGLAFDVPPIGAMVNNPRMRWVVSPTASRVWFGAWTASQLATSSAGMKVFLETPAGVLIDGPIEWTEENGRLAPGDFPFPPTAFTFERAASNGHDQLIHTGWRTESTLTAPRSLDVSAHRGLDVQIRVEATDCRIFSMFALEAYQSTI